MTIRKMAAVVAGTAAMALVLTSCAESDRDDGDNGGDNAAGDNADGTDSTAGGDDGEPAGLGIRESDGLITDNLSFFVPHTIDFDPPQDGTRRGS